jgi:hypothetical protein
LKSCKLYIFVAHTPSSTACDCFLFVSYLINVKDDRDVYYTYASRENGIVNERQTYQT